MKKLYLLIAFLLGANCTAALAVGLPWEAVAWAATLWMFFLWRAAEAREAHYKKMCERAEAIFQKQLNDGKDHS